MKQQTTALAFAVILAVSSRDAHAALGGDVASIESDRVALGATREISSARAWQVHVLHLPSGALVREWVLPSGKVFAIAWGSPVVPDLRLLLGAYFQPYVSSPRTRPEHHMHVVATPDWVVQSAGHPQAFIGRAWLTTQLPKGFDLDEVRAW